MLSTAILACALSTQSWPDLRAGLETKWPNNKELRIACHGHSVPAGYFLDGKVETFNAYPHLLHVALNKAYPHAMIKVFNTSIGGENSISGANRFKQDVLSLKPHVVTIDYSLNDRRQPLEDVRQAWKDMVVSAKDASAIVILLTPTPDLAEDILSPNAPLAAHANQVRELATELEVDLVDSYQVFYDIRKSGQDLSTYMSQGNHPNRRGHELVAKKLAELFQQGGK